MAQKEIKTIKNICEKCKYEWEARVENPKTCPRCKRHDWDVKK